VCDEEGRCVFLAGFAAAAKLSENPAADRRDKAVLSKCEFSILARQMQLLIERMHMLVDRNRYEVNGLCALKRMSDDNRRRARELLARSRQQSQWGGEHSNVACIT
jgi:hypothetical protein